MNRCKIPVREYQEITKTFNPVKYDPEAWVSMAKDAGVKYMVITAKHHDGFVMFKSKASNYNIVDFTPYGKDILRLLHNGEALNFKNTHDGIYIDLPEEAPDEIVSVIELEFDEVLPGYKIMPMNTNSYEIIDAVKEKGKDK